MSPFGRHQAVRKFKLWNLWTTFDSIVRPFPFPKHYRLCCRNRKVVLETFPIHPQFEELTALSSHYLKQRNSSVTLASFATELCQFNSSPKCFTVQDTSHLGLFHPDPG
ncbi:hypothetical protein AVEN_48655-1 [Araneus ventricosus]|uniref:Uncharacterized protein n=1 Tax=Araneus ventricosus TaxID=182803 RepID=A0A4Y2TM91_ARAVE|nr:hypothetical protein AVEN_48655-1 [Araneus ventricosus]